MKEPTTTERGSPATLGELSHTNPYTGESFGDAMVFDRGPVVAADGGEQDATDAPDGADAANATDAPDRADAVGESTAPADDEEQTEEDRLKDVDHTPPVGDGANRVHERGGEHLDEESV